MSFLREYTSIFEGTNDPIITQFEIDVLKINTKYMFESTLGITCDLFVEETENEVQQSSFSKWLEKITVAIKKFLSDMRNMFKDMFSKQEHLDIDAYINSGTGSFELEYDLQVVQSKVDDEMRKGRKIIQQIANNANIDDRIVEAYVDNAADFLNKRGRETLVSAAAIKQLNMSAAKIDSMEDMIDAASNDAKKVKGDPKKEKLVSRVFNTMTHLASEATKARADFSKKLKQAVKKSKKKNGGKK